MGFWKKFGTIVGRVAVQAGVSALEAKASGKPITIGTVGPGVLNEELRRISNETSPPPEVPEVVEIWEGEQYPPSVREGTLSVGFTVRQRNGIQRTRIRYFSDADSALKFEKSVGAVVLGVRLTVMTERELNWIPLPISPAPR